ncbi:MAG: hypothetical protein JWM11_8008, partial [Planctomycetaceae bacterium]|nr:hypothetical protein [Planctomycetaceae bacterium]
PPSRPFCGYEGLSLEELLERSRNEFRLQDAESGAVAPIKPTMSVLPDLVPQQPGAETGVKSEVSIRSANSGDAGVRSGAVSLAESGDCGPPGIHICRMILG